jgi:RNA polymerase sigma factor (sigma-70 family)
MPGDSGPPAPAPENDVPSDVTLGLLNRVRAGDSTAREELIARYIPELTRWTTGRLPGWARHAIDTDDLVQETLIQAFQKLQTFEYRGEGALFAYLRQAMLNRLRSQLRWAKRRPRDVEVEDRVADDAASPLEQAIGAQSVEHYEAALERLKPAEREAVIARVEFGLTYPELAQALGKPTPDAARMTVARAMVRLTEELREVRSGSASDRSRDERR